MDTLPSDLLCLVFKVTNDNQIVDPFSFYYNPDFLRIKYQCVIEHIDNELNKLFGGQRYQIFTKDSVLTGSFLLRLLLQDDWKYGDIDIVSSNSELKIEGSLGPEDLQTGNMTYDMLNCVYYETESYLYGPVDPQMFAMIRSLIKTIDMSNYRQLNKQVLNIITIDATGTTIKEYIEHFDYDFLKNYVYYDGGQLRLFVYDYLSVFNKDGRFKPSPLIWRSLNLYHKYKYRGFKITWSIEEIQKYTTEYINTISGLFGDLVIKFLQKTLTQCGDYVFVSLLDLIQKEQQQPNINSIIIIIVLFLYNGLDMNDHDPKEVDSIREIFDNRSGIYNT